MALLTRRSEPLAAEKVDGLDGEGKPTLDVGLFVSESAIPVTGYIAIEPTEAVLQVVDGENVIIFWYEKLTGYTVKYVYVDGELLAPEKKSET